MSLRQYVQSSSLPVPAAEAFAWHARPGAFERLTPPWERVELTDRRGSIRDGDRTVLRVRIGPLSRQWIAEHHDYIEGRQFCDTQVAGPFRSWEHAHQFEPDGADACRLIDQVEYALPLAAVSHPLVGGAVERKLRRMFAYRHRVTRDDLAAHHPFVGRTPLRVLVSGAGGLIGGALVPMLTTGGHTVVRLARAESARGGIRWNPAAGEIDPAALEGFDAVVHLAGESVARRWSAAQKSRILDSRVRGTRLLAETLAKLNDPPKTFVCASAVGFYGAAGNEPCDEQSPSGSGFLAEVCRAWESAADAARSAGIRTVHARFGVVLSPAGGALAKMLPPFRFGVGGRLGTGKQWMSWIALDDAVGALHHLLMSDAPTGPVNVVAPQAATNVEFTRVLGRVLGRPTIFPVPAAAARLAFGEMADEMLLSGRRVVPQRLQAAEYRFRYADLEPALRHVLGRT